MSDDRLPIKEWPLPELRLRFAELGWPRYRADQVAAWIYGRGVEEVAAMSDLPRDGREALARHFRFQMLKVDKVAVSRDGTIKAALVADDGATIESVLIPEGDRLTLCISTQVGCALACSFCATGTLGFRRNLRTAEIVDQLCRMRALAPEGRAITNLVFMGMGEPLLNREALVRALQIFEAPKGFALGSRKLTVSTAGVVPQIGPLLEAMPVNLAVSLHATTDALRDRLVPLNKKFPLATLLGALREMPHFSRRHPVFFEYILIGGVNDSEDDARRLASILEGIPSKVNLIPMNAHGGSAERAPSADVAKRFADTLMCEGLVVTLRRARGADIAAACGQLSNERAGAPSPAAVVAAH